jgi:L-cysteine/cystine lyase
MIRLQDLLAHRSLFPALGNKQYFNYGGQGPMAQATLDRIQSTYQQIQTVGPFSGAANPLVSGIREALRDRMAQELHVPRTTITLTENVTVGCNIPLWGMDWQAGDHLILSDCEHPGVIAAVQEVQRRFGVEISICPLMATLNQGDPTAMLAAMLKPQTKLVVLSHILWNTGQVLPLQAMVAACHAHQVRVLVDAAQSVGVLPLNLTELGVDFYAFTGHKWWCGPEGVGGLYISPEAQAAVHPTYIGWRGIQYLPSGQPGGWKTGGDRYEVATSAYPLYAGLIEAMDVQSSFANREARYERILALSQQLWQQLSAIETLDCLRQTPPESGLVSFQLASGKHSELVAALEQQSTQVRLIADPNCVRACVHYLTLESEVEALVETIARTLSD